jgi:hypothetical protein
MELREGEREHGRAARPRVGWAGLLAVGWESERPGSDRSRRRMRAAEGRARRQGCQWREVGGQPPPRVLALGRRGTNRHNRRSQ